MTIKCKIQFLTRFISLVIFASCGAPPEKPKEIDIVPKEENINVRISKNLQQTVSYAVINKGRINDSILLAQVQLVEKVYSGNGYKSIWRDDEKWLPAADSLFEFIKSCKEYGLFPADYHMKPVTGSFHQIAYDTLAAKMLHCGAAQT